MNRTREGTRLEVWVELQITYVGLSIILYPETNEIESVSADESEFQAASDEHGSTSK